MKNAIRAISKDLTALIVLILFGAFFLGKFGLGRFDPNIFGFRSVEIIIGLYLANFLAWFRRIIFRVGVTFHE